MTVFTFALWRESILIGVFGNLTLQSEVTKMVERRRSSTSNQISISLLGPPPRLEGEDVAVYEELMARVHRDLKPRDVIEQIWMRDIVDNTIEILRYRRFRTKLLNSLILEAREKALNSAVDDELNRLVDDEWEPPPEVQQKTLLDEIREELERRRKLEKGIDPPPSRPEPEPESESWAECKERLQEDPAVVEKLRKVRKSVQSELDMEHIAAEEFVGVLHDIERIDNLISIAERRRNAVVHEMDRHRAEFAQRMREKLHEIEDADFQTIETKATMVKRLACDQHVQWAKK